MKFEIKARITGKVLFTAGIPDDTEPQFQMRAALEIAVKARAYLADANLAGANLAGASLAGANLADAKSNATPEEIARLDQVRDIILKKPERLLMNDWHSGNWTPEHTPEEEHECGSAHCIAGWLQALCPDEKLRAHASAEYVGRTLAPASAHMFYTSNAVALQWLKDRAYATSLRERFA